ncbi:tetratricopeptide repeat protein [Spirillospora sp. NPDC048819]|uniref:tetratricopeptide repeat protein n=1 Tax=Spirillospora sp. NPDC048819 TaxID=3155268 RepID=UPI0033CBA451
MRFLATGASVAGLVAALTLGSAVVFGGPSEAPAATGAAAGAPASGIAGLQKRLREQPHDAAGWASLGLAYVEQARVTGDTTYYPKADGVLRRSLREEPRNAAALAGLGALAAARHDFHEALRYADRALKANPFEQRAAAVRVDALVELGRYDEALDAAREADAKRPGVPIFTRLAYVRELRGDVGEARRVLGLARDSATDRGDLAYIATQLGELAWNDGDLGRAGREYAEALRQSPGYTPALDGRARVRAARGDIEGALSDRAEIVRRMPLPQYLTEYGELLESQGLDDEAKRQYAVAAAWTRIAKADGVGADLETALSESDHGDPETALRAARAEYERRCPGVQVRQCSVHAADALAWALHVNGRDGEALRYARQATATGYRRAQFHFHRGVIEKALGRRADARRDLAESLRRNPRFSPLWAPRAKAALDDLGGAP